MLILSSGKKKKKEVAIKTSRPAPAVQIRADPKDTLRKCPCPPGPGWKWDQLDSDRRVQASAKMGLHS